MTDDPMHLKLQALGDQVQQAIANSGLPAMGFTILVANGQYLTGESRYRVSREEYEKAMIEYSKRD
jgi:hypothetical protein